MDLKLFSKKDLKDIINSGMNVDVYSELRKEHPEYLKFVWDDKFLNEAFKELGNNNENK